MSEELGGVFVWFPTPDEFEKWKKYTDADVDTFADLCGRMDTAEKIYPNIKYIRKTVYEIDCELKKRNLSNTSDGRKTLMAMLGRESQLGGTQ